MLSNLYKKVQLTQGLFVCYTTTAIMAHTGFPRVRESSVCVGRHLTPPTESTMRHVPAPEQG